MIQQRNLVCLLIGLLLVGCSSRNESQEQVLLDSLAVMQQKLDQQPVIREVIHDTVVIEKMVPVEAPATQVTKPSTDPELSNQLGQYKTEIKKLKDSIDEMQAEYDQTRDSQNNLKAAYESKNQLTSSELSTLQLKFDSLVQVSQTQNTEANKPTTIDTSFFQDRLKNQQIVIQTLKKSLDSLQKEAKQRPAETIKSSNPTLSEAFRVRLIADSIKSKNPTVAARLMNYAYKLSTDSLITTCRQKLMDSHFFYERVGEIPSNLTKVIQHSNQLFALSSTDTLLQYDLTENQLKPQKSYPNVLAFDSQGKYLAYGDASGFMTLISLSTDNIIKKKKAVNDPVAAIHILPRFKQLLVGSTGKVLKRYSFKGDEEARMVGMKGPVRQLDVFRDKVAIAAYDLNPRLYAMDGKLLLRLENQSDTTTAIRFNTYGDQFITAHADGSQRIWSVNGKQKQRIDHQQGFTTQILWSAPYTYFFGTSTGTIVFHQNDQVKLLKGHQSPIIGLFYENEVLTSFDSSGNIFQWKTDGSINASSLMPSEEDRISFQLKY
jgi:WD40 repeat protein